MEMSGCIGFIGVGVMGEPMCRNLALKGGESVLAWDIDPAPLDRLAADAPVARTLQRNNRGGIGRPITNNLRIQWRACT